MTTQDQPTNRQIVKATVTKINGNMPFDLGHVIFLTNCYQSIRLTTEQVRKALPSYVKRVSPGVYRVKGRRVMP